jgi:hypothetical protein
MPRRRRPPTRSPLPAGVVPNRASFTGPELCAIAGIAPKGLSEWRARGLMPPAPPNRRTARYSYELARRAAAIGKAGITAAALPRFDEMIPLILDEAPAPVVPAPASAPTGPADAEIVGTSWKRIELLPGLELHLAEGAPPVLRELVRDVARKFGRTV